jgi:ubiquilin
MGLNTNDPNMAMNMMDNPEVQRQLETLMSNPAMIEQIIQSSPQLRALGPQARQIMQSPMFRQMLSNPQMMRQAMQMQQGMARGGTSAAPQPGLFGLAQQQQQQNALGNGPGTGGAPATGAQPNPFAAMMGGQGAGAGGFDPFAMLGGAGGMGAGASGAPDMAALQSLFGAGSPFGNMGGNAPAAAPADPRSPEERFEVRGPSGHA